jgi:hypothetical protein
VSHICILALSGESTESWGQSELSTSQAQETVLNTLILLSFHSLQSRSYYSNVKDVETFIWEIKQLAQGPITPGFTC